MARVDILSLTPVNQLQRQLGVRLSIHCIILGQEYNVLLKEILSFTSRFYLNKILGVHVKDKSCISAVGL